jgi:hypothetical protein
MSRLRLNDVRCEALFASVLQCSDDPSVPEVAEAIARSMRQHGSRGCAMLMAQEFGDHPEAAAARMRWVREVVVRVFAAATTGPDGSRGRRSPAGTGLAGAVGVWHAA